ncbi:gephyrin-like molybdotransferase Glp [Paenibacillus aceris]|uniref:Molybdopterin molybdenumtransferase n=1 Tax=Paenibacillus aceris TaxID=869555 RepID=A0ABS4I3G3_9BACL|nr:gephyrin-like molybdotransferase Glp [Paenibacillus aceris]MBP1965463.1 molybdopterin molybdotransferase [Paenibacillus aceris]NHW33487.1 molybdopterin molybdotransferase MoeA [Paenibacillus aceris]
METTVSGRIAVTVEEGVEQLLSHCTKEIIEDVPLMRATGRVLARDFYSIFPIPHFRKAAMDGYAVHFSKIASATPRKPVVLPVTSELRAGSSMLHEGNQAAVRIYTGAPVPEIYDTVIMQEAVLSLEEEYPNVRFPHPTERGKHIAEIGEDIREGTLILDEGTVITAKEVSILASFGLHEVGVYRKPTVAIIPIGDELQLPGELLKPNHLYESNGFMLEARLKEIGANCLRYDPVPDHPFLIHSAIQTALMDADVILTCGGVSVGKYDYMLQVMKEISNQTLFTQVLLRPGSPTSAFVVNKKLSLHLSGNPSACFTGFELFVKPALLFKSGRKKFRNEVVEALLADDVRKPCPYPRYVRSFAEVRNSTLYVMPLTNDKSGNIAAFANTNALTLIPSGGQGAKKGDKVQLFQI